MRDQGIMVRPCPECGYAYGKDNIVTMLHASFLLNILTFLQFLSILLLDSWSTLS